MEHPLFRGIVRKDEGGGTLGGSSPLDRDEGVKAYPLPANIALPRRC